MNTRTIAIETELAGLKDEVHQLRYMMGKVLKLLGARIHEEVDDLTSEELMMIASQIFNVTSKLDPDDDLADVSKLKPIKW